MRVTKASLGRDLIKQINLLKDQELQSKMTEHVLENSIIEKSMTAKRLDEMKKLVDKVCFLCHPCFI